MSHKTTQVVGKLRGQELLLRQDEQIGSLKKKTTVNWHLEKNGTKKPRKKHEPETHTLGIQKYRVLDRGKVKAERS